MTWKLASETVTFTWVETLITGSGGEYAITLIMKDTKFVVNNPQMNLNPYVA